MAEEKILTETEIETEAENETEKPSKCHVYGRLARK